MKVKVRIAPSPTGFLHIGTAQSALYNWLFAKKNGGEFCLRIEDTDRERSTKEYEQSILNALEWLGFKWDGEVVRQSERIPKYRAALEELLSKENAFYCHHTQDELEDERKNQEANKKPPIHICGHKNTDQGKQPGGIIRLDVLKYDFNDIKFNDLIRGPIVFNNFFIGDFSIAKSLDEPLYNFAVVVDDADMGITHVIRGEDHISNTPKQILIYEALGIQKEKQPEFAHLPLILAPDRSKLSKRHGATAVVDFKKDYLPEALTNFLGTLSYTFSKEIMTNEEMVEEFELSKVHKSGAIFDIKKLNWLNSQYVKKLSPDEFKKIVGMSEIPDAAVLLITERLEKLSDVQGFDYFWKEPEYNSELLRWKNTELHLVKNALEGIQGVIENWDFQDENVLRVRLDALAGKDRGLVYWPLRVALTGKEKSPDPIKVLGVIGKKEALERIDNAIEKLK